MAPAGLFSGLPITYTSADFESGIVEADDPHGIDVLATVAAIQRVYCDRQQIIARVLEFIHANGIEKIVADVRISYLAGDIAAAAGIPCIGIGNFTWKWIYQPYLQGITGTEVFTDMFLPAAISPRGRIRDIPALGAVSRSPPEKSLPRSSTRVGLRRIRLPAQNSRGQAWPSHARSSPNRSRSVT